MIDRENPNDARIQGHLGIQVKSIRTIKETCTCPLKTGLKVLTENGAEDCCAVQTNVGTANSDSKRWEVVCTTIPDAAQSCGCGEVCICHQEFERNYV